MMGVVMFFGWWSSSEGGVRRGGGCFFLPLIILCGSFYVFDDFRIGWLFPLIGIGLAWLLLSGVFSGQPEKPKRDFETEKPKHGSDYLYRDDGDVLEVVEPPEETDSYSDDDQPL